MRPSCWYPMPRCIYITLFSSDSRRDFVLHLNLLSRKWNERWCLFLSSNQTAVSCALYYRKMCGEFMVESRNAKRINIVSQVSIVSHIVTWQHPEFQSFIKNTIRLNYFFFFPDSDQRDTKLSLYIHAFVECTSDRFWSKFLSSRHLRYW